MSIFRRLWAFVRRPAVAVTMVAAMAFGGLMLASPAAHANPVSVPSPVVGFVTYDCTTQSLSFEIAYPANHVTIDWSTPDGGGASASFAVAKTAPFTEPMTLADGTYTLGVTEYPVAGQPGVDFSQKFTVKCATASPSPTGNPVADHVVYCNTQSGKLQQGSEDAGLHNPNLIKVGDVADIGGKWDSEAANAKWGAQCAAPTKPPTVTATPTNPESTTTPTVTETPSATETPSTTTPTVTETPSATETPTATTSTTTTVTTPATTAPAVTTKPSVAAVVNPVVPKQGDGGVVVP